MWKFFWANVIMLRCVKKYMNILNIAKEIDNSVFSVTDQVICNGLIAKTVEVLKVQHLFLYTA